MESKIVDQLLTTENAASCILLADGLSCPLLKEAAINTYFQNPEEAVKSEGWKNIKESATLLEEMLHYATTGSQVPLDSNAIKKKSSLTAEEISKLDVTLLRECLSAAGLEVDGSLDMLKKRLTEYHIPQKENSKTTVRRTSLRRQRRRLFREKY